MRCKTGSPLERPERVASLEDVARAAGVSKTTVSFVLNNKGNIPASTRAHVLGVVEALGYTRNISARSLRDKLTRVIGYAKSPYQRKVHPVMNHFLAEVVSECARLGWHVLLYPGVPPGAPSALASYREMVASGRLDGVLLSSLELSDERLTLLHEELKFPVVSFGRTLSALDKVTSWVDVDGAAGVRLATDHLIAGGHRRIGIIASSAGEVVGRCRLEGYLQSLSAHGLTADERLIVRTPGEIKHGYEAAGTLLNLPEPPTALVALSDLSASGALHYCAHATKRVAVTGFDDDPLADVVGLTSLRQPVARAASLLVELLLGHVKGNAEAKQHLLEPQLIIRASSQVAP